MAWLRHAASLLALMVPAFSPSAWAAEADEFYKGKTISVIVGFAAGGGYDNYARLLARHMPRHIPAR